MRLTDTTLATRMAENLLPPRQFNIGSSDQYSEWKTWIASFEIYAAALELEKKPGTVQLATMLHCLGPSVQRIFTTLPGDKSSLKEARLVLEGYFAPKRNVVAERYRFRSRQQYANEPIDVYLTALRELIKTCEFGELEDEMLRDQIVEKCFSRRLKERLLSQDDLDLAKAVKIARNTENAVNEARLLHDRQLNEPLENVQRVHAGRKFSCYRCGSTEHKPDECHAKNKKCNKCSKIGHFARVCRSSQTRKDNQKVKEREIVNRKKNKRYKVRAVEGQAESSGEQDSASQSDEEYVLYIKNKDDHLLISVNGRKIKTVADTGCKQNIISSQLYKEQFKRCPLKRTNKKFVTYGQQNPLQCLGYFDADLTTGMKSINEHVYVIEGHAESLLGRQSCFDLDILKQVKVMNIGDVSCTKVNSDKLNLLVEEYDDLFHGLGNITNFAHKINIDPNVKAVSQPLRRIPLSQMEVVSDEIDKMLDNGVIEKSTKPSPWVSNIVVVPKQSGGIRLCCDYRELNKAIIRERHVLPKVDDTLNSLSGSRYFAKIDARSGFLQLSLAEESRHLTTFITNSGCFQFKRVPFGLSDISETFQRVMEEILFGLDGVEISVDDVIVHARTIDELIVRLRKVFERCRQRNLKLNPSKCEFGLTEIKVLGHVVTSQGIKPDPAKTKAIRDAPMPRNVSELKSFLGLCGYVSKFIPHYADIVEPLRELTRKGANWLWTVRQSRAFNDLKSVLSSEQVLACFKLGFPTLLITDASPVGLGAVLVQKQGDNEFKPIAYISRSLSPTEKRYAQIEREALACVWAVERFHNYLFGNEFVLCVDNKPLTSLLAPDCKKILPPRIQRLAWRLYQYNYKIEHVAGKMNIADLLSRLPLMELDETTSGDVADLYVRFIVEHNDSERAISIEEIKIETGKDETLSFLSNLRFPL